MEAQFITVIEYQLVQMIRTRLRQAGVYASCVAASKGSSASPPPPRWTDGRFLHVRKVTRGEPLQQQAIYAPFGIEPGGIRTHIV